MCRYIQNGITDAGKGNGDIQINPCGKGRQNSCANRRWILHFPRVWLV